MKFIFSFLLASACFVFSNCSNQKTQAPATCFKGRLEIKGICSNYTIKVLESGLDTSRFFDTSKFVAEWQDETTGKNYTNVFALGSPCSFPSTIKAGDEFYFTLSDAKEQCPVCMAYYPTPPKKLSIKVLDSPCN